MQRIDSWFEKVASSYRRLNYWLGLATGFIILAIMIITSLLVFTRYVLRAPLMWSMPVTQYLLLYSAMLGGAYVLSKGGHVNVDFVLVRLSQKKRKVLEAITSVMGLVFGVILTWQTWNLTWDAYTLKYSTGFPLVIPLFIVYLIMPIGGVLLSVEFLIKTISSITWLRRGSEGTGQPAGEAQL